MQVKPWYKSLTIWFSSVVFFLPDIAMFLSEAVDLTIVDNPQLLYVLTKILALINLYLRLRTKKEIKI